MEATQLPFGLNEVPESTRLAVDLASTLDQIAEATRRADPGLERLGQRGSEATRSVAAYKLAVSRIGAWPPSALSRAPSSTHFPALVAVSDLARMNSATSLAGRARPSLELGAAGSDLRPATDRQAYASRAESELKLSKPVGDPSKSGDLSARTVGGRNGFRDDASSVRRLTPALQTSLETTPLSPLVLSPSVRTFSREREWNGPVDRIDRAIEALEDAARTLKDVIVSAAANRERRSTSPEPDSNRAVQRAAVAQGTVVF